MGLKTERTISIKPVILKRQWIWYFRLQKTQDLLYDSTKDFLALRYEGRTHERNWMAEKDKLLHELDRCHSEMQIRPAIYR